MFEEIKEVVSIQAWLPLWRNRKKTRSVRFWKSGSKKKICSYHLKNVPTNTLYSLFCLICNKSIPVKHQGKANLDSHCTSKKHLDLLNSKRVQRPITPHFVAVGSDLDKPVSAAKVTVTGFLAKHNPPFATADHLAPLFRNIFPDSKIAKA